jgi:hypothetical protein
MNEGVQATKLAERRCLATHLPVGFGYPRSLERDHHEQVGNNAETSVNFKYAQHAHDIRMTDFLKDINFPSERDKVIF